MFLTVTSVLIEAQSIRAPGGLAIMYARLNYLCQNRLRTGCPIGNRCCRLV